MSRRPYAASHLLKVVALGSADDLQAAMALWARDYARTYPVQGGAFKRALAGISRLGSPSRLELDADAWQAGLRALESKDAQGNGATKINIMLDAMQAQMEKLGEPWSARLSSFGQAAANLGRLASFEAVLARFDDRKDQLSLLGKASRAARRRGHDSFADEMDRRRRSIIEEFKIQAELGHLGSKASKRNRTHRL